MPPSVAFREGIQDTYTQCFGDLEEEDENAHLLSPPSPHWVELRSQHFCQQYVLQTPRFKNHSCQLNRYLKQLIESPLLKSQNC